MELREGLPLLLQQFQALFRKNLLLSGRNKRALFVQIFSSFFFIFLIFCIQKTTESGKAFADDPDPKPLTSLPIPPCEEKHYIRPPCYDFIWSGNSSSKIETIVSRIMANNPGRPIPPSKVKSFKISSEVDEWLFNNPLQCPGALHFVERGASVINYGIQTNSTVNSRRGIVEDPTFKFQIPLQIAAEREIARYLIGDPNFSWLVSLKSFAHPGLKKYSAVGMIGPTFFLAIALFGFVFQMSSLVTEKELKLRQAMTMMGLYDTAYWLSWLTWETIIVFLTSLLTVLFGMMFKFDFFLYNSFAVSFYLFFLFQLNMIGFAFMLSTFVNKSSTSTTLGFSIFIISFITRIVSLVGYPYSVGYSRLSRFIWSLFPPNIFSKGLQILVDATSTNEKAGMSWSQTAKCGEKDPMCVVTMSDIYKWLLSEFYLWLLLTLYFDNIMPTPSGMRKSVFYFLNPGYWTGNDGNKVEDGSVCSCATPDPLVENATPDDKDKDVLEEENIVKQQAKEGVDPNVAVQIRGLAKTYPGNLKISCCCCCCCKCKRTSAFHAVKGLWLNFAKDQLFCLLGPNGAGKTTTISCLTGIATVTGGDALVYGSSVRSSVGMANIRKMMGVCPQFDIFWDALSGEEHLHFFACIKGMPPASIQSIAQKSLEEVKLSKAARVRAGNYSGGMKRRLSIATALIGDPKLVILDEPTTGIDPITRRHVWDIIADAKKGRAIVLTTHSMEEADVLGDRIGIMAKGRLRCIGTSIRLKSRFGNGFIVNINFSGSTKGTPAGEDTAETAQQQAVKQFFKYHLDVVPKEENELFQTFVIPQAKEGLLTTFFSELQWRQEEFGIADIQLSLTTLEEVFLSIARQAELESAAAERVETVTLTSGESLEVPLGARFVGIPGTESAENPRGFMVEVSWEQDESGSLCISSHSREIPIPPHVLLTVPLTATMKRDSQGSAVPLRGFVIDPKEFGW